MHQHKVSHRVATGSTTQIEALVEGTLLKGEGKGHRDLMPVPGLIKNGTSTPVVGSSTVSLSNLL